MDDRRIGAGCSRCPYSGPVERCEDCPDAYTPRAAFCENYSREAEADSSGRRKKKEIKRKKRRTIL